MAVVLVVDDEPDVRLVARVVLVSAGYEVIEAGTGEEALAKLADDVQPDAVLLDVRMPGMGGWETLKRMKRHGDLTDLPVVIFTAHLTARKEAPGEWKDYEHFLTKPFDPDGLLEAVRQAIGEPSGD